MPGLIGFKCPSDGTQRSFSYCISQCPRRCMSFPILLALSNSTRETDPAVYHVTEILNPPQVVYLTRNNEFYSDPFSLIWGTFGSAFHTMIERALTERSESGEPCLYITEKNFKADLGIAFLSGTADLYDVSTDTLWDFKTIKTYAVKQLLAGNFEGNKYKDQLNIYRAFAFPEAKHLFIEAIIKDWSQAVMNNDGIRPVEDIEIPIEPMADVIQKVGALVSEHVETQKSGKPRPCTKEERWISMNPRSKNCGVPLRCRDYCGVSDLCPQYKGGFGE